MIMGQAAFTAYQIGIFAWFCVGAAIVGFFAIRDLIKMFRDGKK